MAYDWKINSVKLHHKNMVEEETGLWLKNNYRLSCLFGSNIKIMINSSPFNVLSSWIFPLTIVSYRPPISRDSRELWFPNVVKNLPMIKFPTKTHWRSAHDWEGKKDFIYFHLLRKTPCAQYTPCNQSFSRTVSLSHTHSTFYPCTYTNTLWLTFLLYTLVRSHTHSLTHTYFTHVHQQWNQTEHESPGHSLLSIRDQKARLFVIWAKQFLFSLNKLSFNLL